jgi:hypothetical protein
MCHAKAQTSRCEAYITYSNIKDLHDGLIKTPFDEYGNYRHREPTEAIMDEEDDNDDESYAGSHSSEDTVLRADSISSEEQEELQESETQGIIKVFHDVVCNLNQTYLFDDDPFQDFRVNKLKSKKKEIDYQRFQLYFLNVPVQKVKRTFENTTQYATNVMAGDHIMQTIQSPYPALNVLRRNEPVATDTIYAGYASHQHGRPEDGPAFRGKTLSCC